MRYCVEFDDLCDQTAYTLQVLKAIKGEWPEFKVTLFTIPARTSPIVIEEAKKMGDWIALAPHGWRHTKGECLSWTKEEALSKLRLAAEKGVDAPTFRAPGWLLDHETYAACRELGYTVADHFVYRASQEGDKVYTYNNTAGKAPLVRAVHGHLSRSQYVDNWILKMVQDGRIRFAKESEFLFPWEAAVVLDRPVEEMAL